MPVTAYHAASGLLFGYFLRKYIHWPTFIVVTSILVDIEPMLVVLGFLRNYPVHGYAHTFVASIVLGTIAGVFMYLIDKPLYPLYRALHLVIRDKYDLKHYVLGGVLGWSLHVFLDAPIYVDIKPFLPVQENLFFFGDEQVIQIAYDILLVIGLTIYIIYFYRASVKIENRYITEFKLGILSILAGMLVFPLGLTNTLLPRIGISFITSLSLLAIGLVISIYSLKSINLLSPIMFYVVLLLMVIAIGISALSPISGFARSNWVLISWILVIVILFLLRKSLRSVKICKERFSVIDLIIIGWFTSVFLIGIPLLFLSLLLLIVKAGDLLRNAKT
ncbi:MAG: hypothetical protein ABWW65_04595 [Thermoprotei archaeon]